VKSSFLLLTLALAALPATARADELVFWDGRTVTGVRVTAESVKQVEYKRGAAAQKVDTREIKSIVYGETSEDFQQGVAAREAGNMEDAANAFLTAAADEALDTRPFIQATALVEAANALADRSNFAEALGYYDELLQRFPDTRHLARALLGRGQALFMTREFDEARAAFEKLKAEVTARNLGEVWDLEADFYLLWADEAAGKSVLDGYTALRQRAQAGHPGVANRCALRMGRALLASAKSQGDARAAQAYFDEIIEGRLSTDADVVAGAFNGRGQCHFATGTAYMAAADKARGARDEESAEAARADALAAFKDARLDFLRVQTVYKGVAREQPEALYMGARAFFQIGQIDKGETEAEGFGRLLLKRCRDGYPETEWGIKAAKEL